MGNHPRVWVVQEGRNDYAPAEKYGEVRFVTTGDYRSIRDSQQNAEVINDVRRFKSHYIQGVDYLIPAGNPMLTAMVMMSLPKGEHKFLKWDGRRASYILFNISGV